ncbi:putative membrane protein [Terriglobus roseus DSM 18391]|uniref:Putative membrane protein n=1 Tax=Terriglobus roseus (strain DSM 18391 / NRRL B-41598 / KBS 63) TaxID=926566 RepID=I3ZEA1_TERRK|nr:SMR family transporter [Terriglobus roseus]AFL87569.1 putative membrane protein [Terriglobus roseus DSM 18391]
MTLSFTSVSSAWTALAVSIGLASVAQVVLKHATNLVAASNQRRKGLPWMVLWAVMFVAATACWLVALKTLDISYAYPLLSLGFVLVSGLAALLLHERVSRQRWIAIGVISCGAAMVAGSI